ncbi:MAG: hypothetical protein V3T05_06795 [Myxococcota bacterium]
MTWETWRRNEGRRRDDVAQLIINQQLHGVFKDMPFAYDEAQIMNGIVATDIAEVDIPNGAEYEALVRRAREALPWLEIHRYDRKTN